MRRVWTLRNGQLAEEWLVIRQEADQRYSYALRNAAPDMSAARLAWLKCVRHFVERSNQDARSEVGWDEFQAQKFRAWEHQLALTILATWFIYSLQRRDAGQGGNLEGYYHKGVQAGEQWVYHNPFIPARLSDEEIAVATCLEKMARYVAGGSSFCSLAEASQDQYLGLLLERAAQTGEVVQTARQPWA